MATRLSSKEDYESLLDKYDTWMFDCDGVLWHDDCPIDGAMEVLNVLRERGKQLLFVTNNTTKHRQSYMAKLDRFGVQATVDEIYSPAYAAAVYISSVLKLPENKKVYVIGMSGVEEELREENISFTGGTDPTDNTLQPFNLADFVLDPDIAVVLCAFDKKINYTKLSKAFQYLTRNPGCQFVVTNEENVFPSVNGFLPGAGCISAPLRFALGREPVVIGKPAKTMLDCIRAKFNLDLARTIMVGDRLDTDILFGKSGGLATLLVLTGLTTREDISGPHASSTIPNYVTKSLGDFRVIRSANRRDIPGIPLS